MRPNKVETAVQWFHMSRAMFAWFSGYGNLIYKISKGYIYQPLRSGRIWHKVIVFFLPY